VAHDEEKRLAARVRDLRKALKLSQEKFAERAGLKYKHYQAWEAGRKVNIQFSTLKKLAKACEMELWELLNFDADPAILAEHAPEETSVKPPRRPRAR
jgi:transcriptional regulator with XRE-family HTH domain